MIPVLGLLLVVPLLGLLAVTRLGAMRLVRPVALAAALVELALAVWLAVAFRPGEPATQFVERHSLGWLSLYLGVDGASVLFVPLVALLAVLTLTRSDQVPDGHLTRVVAGVLISEWSLIGALVSLNLLQFWLFCVVELLAIVVMATTESNRVSTLPRQLAFRVMGEGLVLLAIVLMGWHMAAGSPGPWSFDIDHLTASETTRMWDARFGVLLFYGFAVRLALFPFHAWLPELAATTWLPFNLMVMASVKVGAYALLRFVLPVLPAAAEDWATAAVALGLVGTLYGALMALLQNDLRRLIAYAAVSQNGALLVGLFALNHAGLQGGLLLALNLCLATAGLFFATSLLHQRTGTTRLDEFGGLFERLPLLGLTFLAAALGTLAMPGTPGFEAAHLALEGMLERFHWAAAYGAAAGNVMVASVLLWAYQRAFFTRAPGPEMALQDLRGSERWVAAVFCAAIFGIGLYAHPWIETVSASLEHLASAATDSLELD
jgi:NADH-quinone oxidoreductase subunit M